MCLYFFFLASEVSTAGYSITVACLLVFIVWKWHYTYKKLVWPGRRVIVSICFLFVPLFISAFLNGDMKSFNGTVRYLYWSGSFLITFLTVQLLKKTCAADMGNFLALIFLIIIALFQSLYLMVPRVSAYFASPNSFALIMEWSIPFFVASFLYFRNKLSNLLRIFGLGILCLSCFSLVLSQSRGGIAGCLLGFIILILIRRTVLNRKFSKKNGMLVIATITGIFIVGSFFLGTREFGRSYDYERVLLLKSSYNMWNDNKFIGIGLTNWEELYQHKYILPEAKEPDLSIPHNIIAFFFSTTGLLGGLGYLIFVVNIWIYLIKAMKKNPENWYIQAMLWASIAIFIHGMVDVGMADKIGIRLFFGWLGLSVASTIVEIKSNNNNENDYIGD